MLNLSVIYPCMHCNTFCVGLLLYVEGRRHDKLWIYVQKFVNASDKWCHITLLNNIYIYMLYCWVSYNYH